MAVDWIAVEGLYRAGTMSLRELAAAQGTKEGTIRSRAKRLGWVQDAAGTKRAMVSNLMSGVTQDVTQCAMREIEAAAAQDADDMRLGLKGARAILQSAVDSIGLQGVHETDNGLLELKIDPKDLRTLSECIRINVETIRTIRELDKAPEVSQGSGDRIQVNIVFGGTNG